MNGVLVYRVGKSLLCRRLQKRWVAGFLICLWATLGASASSPPAGLVGWWPGEGNATDLVGTNNGSLFGGVVANQPGFVGLGFTFSGTNGGVAIPSTQELRPTNFTLETWVRFNSLDSPAWGGSPEGDQYIIFQQNSRTMDFEGISLTKTRLASGDVFWFGVTSVSAQSAVVRSATLIRTGLWYHVAAVRGSNYLQLYVNGNLEAQTNVDFPQDYGVSPLFFGTSGEEYWDRKLNGSLDEVSLYNRPLTSNEIAAIYIVGSAGKPKSPQIAKPPRSVAVLPGDSGSFSVSADGLEPFYYRWQLAGTNLVDNSQFQGTTNATLTILNAQMGNAGGYSVIVSNRFGQVTSEVVNLTVVPLVVWGAWGGLATLVPLDATNVIAVSPGARHLLALRSDGTVTAWGDNSYGQCTVPEAATNVVSICAGNFHSLALRGDGTVVAWGNNNTGKAVDGVSNVVAIAANTVESMALRDDGSVVTWVQNRDLAVAGASNLVTIALGAGAYFGLGVDGNVVGWGADWNLPPEATNMISLSAGILHCTGVRADGNAYGWGTNWDTGALPNGTNLVATADGGYGGLGLRADGTVVAWGTELPMPITNAVAVAAGPYQAIVMLRDPTLKIPPILWSQPSSRAAIPGSTIVVHSAASGTGPLYYQWYFNTTPLDGQTNRWLALKNVQSGDDGNYSVTVTNALGSATSVPMTLKVAFVPVITDQPKDVSGLVGADSGFTVGADGTEPLSYQWYFDGFPVSGNSGATEATLTLLNIQENFAGEYTVIVSNAFGSVTSQVARLTLLLPPSITAQPTNQTVDLQTKVTLSVSATGTQPLCYQWRQNGMALTNDGNISGTDADRLILSNVLARYDGLYDVVITNAYGAITSSVAILRVLREPSITSQSTDESVFVGGGTNFLVQVKGDLPFAFQWFHNGVALSGDGHLSGTTSSNLTILNAQSGDAGSYSLAISNVWGAVTSAPVNLSILGVPSIVTQPTNQTVGAGTNVSFKVGASGLGTLAYQWRFNGKVLIGVTNVVLTLVNIQDVNAGDYDVVVTNQYAAVTSGVATLTVLPSSPWITQQPTSRVASVNQSIAFSCSAKGTQPMFYQWQKDGADLPGANGSTLTFTNLNGSMAGVYRASISNSAGITLTTNVTLSVVPVVMWGITNLTPAPSWIPFTVPASATNVVAIAAGRTSYGPPSLVLRTDGTLVAWGYPVGGPPAVPANATNVMAIAVGGSGDSQFHTLALRKDGTVLAWGYNVLGQTNVPNSATNVVAVAAGALFSMALRADGRVIAWGDGKAGETNVPASVTNVVAIAAGLYHCLALRADGTVVGWGYNVFGEATNLASATNIVAIAAGGEQSLALRSDGVLLGIMTTNNTTNPKLMGAPPLDATNLVAISAGAYHTLGLRADGTVVAWGYNAFGQATVPSNITNAIAVAAGYFHNLVLMSDATTPVLPVVQPLEVNRTVKAGADVLLRATVNNALMSYQWQCNGTNIPGATRSFLFLKGTGAQQSGSYSVQVSNAAGTVTSTTLNLVVWPPLSLSRSGDQVVALWDGSFVLQSATNISGPYLDASESSPYTNDLFVDPMRFFKLRQPDGQ